MKRAEVWTLAVNAEIGAPASVSVHDSHHAAVAWLRSSWDECGELAWAEWDTFISQLGDRGIVATIDSHIVWVD